VTQSIFSSTILMRIYSQIHVIVLTQVKKALCIIFKKGGDPKEIIKLEYSDVVNFHKKFYHPSNCTFISYGDMDFTEHLSLLQNNCLAEFSYQEIDSSIPFETRIKSPKDINKTFKPDLMRDIEKQAKIALVYLCNKSHDVYESFAL
jgi:presequence protease